MRFGSAFLCLLFGWATLSIISVWARPLLPIDETRYAQVAWEMHLSGDWLVPRIHGEPYSHKPPLLFWLINLGWSVLGEHPWVARLVGALITLADLLLLGALARRLWPGDARAAALAPWVFYASLLVLALSTTLMFDLLMTCAVLIGVLGLLDTVQRDRGWLLFALATALGLLAKGPALLLYLLPVTLASPWWLARAPAAGWARWHGYLLLSLAVGIALALCWAIPAVARGGEAYRDMLLWGQTAGRMANAFAHERPWWWYLPLLPLLLLPWALWPHLWRALHRLLRQAAAAERLCLVWLLAGVLGFSAISGKQVHYLLPLMPAWALLVARALSQLPAPRPGLASCMLVLAPWLLAGSALAIGPLLGSAVKVPGWLRELSPWAGAALVAATLAWLVPLRRRPGALSLAALPLMFLILLHGLVIKAIAPHFALLPLTDHLEAAQRQGKAIALAAQFRDQYPFSRPMPQVMTLLREGEEIAWARANPQGLLVINHKRISAEQLQAAQRYQPIRSGYSVIWSAQTLLDTPGLLDSELPLNALNIAD
ncbi:glycosyltransferase family 39 protein [Pseudomonas entomophila]|uniref:ArnT family glycosyltransferase n=1 Tax=Pseudomonas entomophila TaxID=312306 RepID=UPI001BD1948D|nr:glycosyltransferase family 39 protein [Pseudomonas entomophila]QVM89533.1 glycosyltransferase family 39 protein [Pseudomonas entomophila]